MALYISTVWMKLANQHQSCLFQLVAPVLPGHASRLC